jgi:hypothetical protein
MIYRRSLDNAINNINRTMVRFNLTKKDFVVKHLKMDFSKIMDSPEEPQFLEMVEVHYGYSGFLTDIENLEAIKKYLETE